MSDDKPPYDFFDLLFCGPSTYKRREEANEEHSLEQIAKQARADRKEQVYRLPYPSVIGDLLSTEEIYGRRQRYNNAYATAWKQSHDQAIRNERRNDLIV